MPFDLVIVESPAKAKTIEKYLGKNYKVLASIGHVKDLPEKELGVDLEDFSPKYTVIKGKKKVIDQLKKEAELAEKVFLAPDPDREGEAIAWHISEEIKKKNPSIYRVQFNEITKKGVAEGIKNRSSINQSRVDAQQSRRILDRLVGYQVSPLLWKPLKYGLSAGRVQTVALRIICEREDEIEKFIPKEFWTVDGFFENKGSEIKARLEKKDGKKFEINNEDECKQVLQELENKNANVLKVDKKVVISAPPLPFITSKLQQDAIRKLGFSAKKTMSVAQQLYEGVEIGSEGPMGLITYMRTDSTRVSEDSVVAAKKYILENFGSEFSGKNSVRKGKSFSKVQDAHEAIRPSDPMRSPDSLKKYLNNDQFRLYKLIWERFIASQMSEAEYFSTTVIIGVDKYEFKASGKVLKFAGYTKVYKESADENEQAEENLFYDLNESDKLEVIKYVEKQQFTTPPPRYSEASLVKTLEQNGIGRPSTYASIISTLLERSYIENKEKKLYPTELGRIVNSVLVSNFNDIFEVNFTASMEKELDQVEAGNVDWKDSLKQFYSKFAPELEKANKKLNLDLKVAKKCPECGEDLTLKYGKNGPFVACTRYPDCKFTANYKRGEDGEIILLEKNDFEKSGINCEKCGLELVFKKTRFGEILACPGYPECKNIKNFIRKNDGTFIVINANDKLSDNCPECGNELVVKKGPSGIFAGCKNYPKCKFTSNIKISEEGSLKALILKVAKFNCEKCGAQMVLKKSRRGMFFACSNYPECKNTKVAVKTEDDEIVPKS